MCEDCPPLTRGVFVTHKITSQMLRNGLTSTLEKGHLRAWMNAIHGPIFDGGEHVYGLPQSTLRGSHTRGAYRYSLGVRVHQRIAMKGGRGGKKLSGEGWW